jgi:large subunit ribosomal protein L29
MKPSELRGMSFDELRGELSEQERGFYNLRFRKSVGEDIHATEFKRIKRDIARIKTLLTEKEKTGATAQAEGSKARK